VVAAAGRTVGSLGLEINVDYVAACMLDLSGELRIRHRRDGDNRQLSTNRVLRRVRTLAAKTLAESQQLNIRCVGATVALPGLVDPGTGTLFVAPNLHWWGEHGTDPTAQLAIDGLPNIGVDNEANLAALAESRFGAGQRVSSFVYVSGGVGIGAGVVINGELVRGSHGFAGELGHVAVSASGPKCSCGAKGCLEVSDRSPAALAAALRAVVHLVDPEAIILGGTFSAVSDQYLEDVTALLHRDTLGARWRPCSIRRSMLGPNAALIGAATVAVDGVLMDPTTVPSTTGG
jgi:predicted NBD/HSP70 family sugar kinase